jgi:hypothetical protein
MPMLMRRCRIQSVGVARTSECAGLFIGRRGRSRKHEGHPPYVSERDAYVSAELGLAFYKCLDFKSRPTHHPPCTKLTSSSKLNIIRFRIVRFRSVAGKEDVYAAAVPFTHP